MGEIKNENLRALLSRLDQGMQDATAAGKYPVAIRLGSSNYALLKSDSGGERMLVPIAAPQPTATYRYGSIAVIEDAGVGPAFVFDCEGSEPFIVDGDLT